MLKETLPDSGVIELMEQSGALLKGHFELASGLHSNRYIQCALLLEDPARAQVVGRHLANLLKDRMGEGGVGVVVSPAVGGIVIGHEVARALGVRSIFAERLGGKMTLRRGFGIAPGERAVVVEDVYTTGGSIREVIQVVGDTGGEVVAVGSIVNRGVEVDFGIPTVYLVRAEIENHQPRECPLCKEGSEVVKPGTKRLQMGSK